MLVNPVMLFNTAVESIEGRGDISAYSVGSEVITVGSDKCELIKLMRFIDTAE